MDETNDVLVCRILADGDRVGWRSDVGQVFWDQNDDGESDGGNVGAVVGSHLVEDDVLVLVHKPAYWIRPCSSSAASSPLH